MAVCMIRSGRAGKVVCTLAVADWGVVLVLLLLGEALAAGISALVCVVLFALAILLLYHRKRPLDL